MGVDHCCTHILMTKEFLNGADVVAVLEQVRGEGVAVSIVILPMNSLWPPLSIGTIPFMVSRSRS
jgi:hypothetical protein